MVNGRAREITEFVEFRAKIVDLKASFRAAVLDDLIGDVFLDLDFLLEQQVAWDYNGCRIHLRRERRRVEEIK